MEWFILLFFFLFGLVIGSYLNVAIYRLPLHLSTAKGRSFCPQCHHPLSAMDLIPVSYTHLDVYKRQYWFWMKRTKC